MRGGPRAGLGDGAMSASLQVQIPPLTPQAPPTPDSMGQISPQSAAAMVAFQYPPASYEAAQTRPAVSPIVSYHQGMSAWGSPPEAMAAFEPEFSSPMVSGSGLLSLPAL